MATSAQIAANRANASLSTGPTSEKGKQTSSRNHLSHGFRSSNVLLPGDDPAEYEALLEELSDHFDPEDLTERRFVREMADAEWRLRRVRDYRQQILCTRIAELAAAQPGLDPLALQALAFDAALSKSSLAACLRYEAQFQRQYDRAYQGWMSYRERASRHHARESRAALDATLAAPPPVLPFEPNFAPPPPQSVDKEKGRPGSVGRPIHAESPVFPEPLRSFPLEQSCGGPR